jgi:hypothetical protein
MLDDLVVIRPRRRLDRCGTQTVVMAVAGATESGSTVLIDLGAADGSGPRPGPLLTGAGACPSSLATVPAAGCVQLAFHDQAWTLDLQARRFCRSATPVAPSFVRPADWTPMTSIWVTAEQTSVLTADGTLVSAAVSWNHDAAVARHRRRTPVRDGAPISAA